MTEESKKGTNAPTEKKLPPGVVEIPLHKVQTSQPVHQPPHHPIHDRYHDENGLTPLQEANIGGTILEHARVGGVRHKFLYDKDGNKIPPPPPPHLVDASHEKHTLHEASSHENQEHSK